MSTRAPAPCLLVALLALALPGTRAQAQAAASETAATPPNDPPAGYRETINAAVAEFGAGHHAEARALFRQAHAVDANARTLRGIGMCAFELREYAEALRTLEAALAHPRRPLTEAMRAEVEALRARASAFVGRYDLYLPEGATLFVDGGANPATREEDGALLLSLGTHVLSARREGATLAEARVEVRGGERERLELLPAPEPAVSAPPSPEPEGPAVVSIPPIPHPDLGPGIATLTLGSALVLGGAVSLIAGLVDAERVRGATLGTPWSDLEGSYDRAPILEGVGIAAALTGAGMLVLGVVLLDDADAQARRASLRLGPGSIVVRGSF